MNYLNENIFLYNNFDFIRISLSSPEKIKSWSFGEVKKPETINYRTLKPEKDGLFCSKIFGPIKDFECLCGKYKKIKYKGIICEKCSVEVISSKVRRNRMAHINLIVPVSHVWFLKSLPSKISILLDISLKKIEKVIYFESYIIIESKIKLLHVGEILSEEEYIENKKKYENNFTACMGAEAILILLKRINIKDEYDSLLRQINNNSFNNIKNKIFKRFKIIESFYNSNNKPEWMILTVLPVLPPDLRPLVPLEGGRFASSDLNDLYRRIINRNNRLKKLIELSAPEIIIKNEKRMLQESVDYLLDNGKRGKLLLNNKRPLKSLSDMIKGKQGRFRQNLLGKRVDFSGRSVITVGPNLKLNQCGLPKLIAIELFKPFIYGRLESLGMSSSIKMSKKILDRKDPIILDILESIVKDYPILLNRAPTLHRLGIQAFEPIIISGKSIQLHPLVCSAYNADFDGDQMAIHIPLTIESQLESKILMMSTNNILSSSNGEPIIFPSQDVILGLYYITKDIDNYNKKLLDNNIYTAKEIEQLYNLDVLKINDYVNVKIIEFKKKNFIFVEVSKIILTTVGRILLWNIMPKGLEYELINKTINKSIIIDIIKKCYNILGLKKTVKLLDKLMNLGFYHSTLSGISIGIDDLITIDNKDVIIDNSFNKVNKVSEQYKLGLITLDEKFNKTIDIWSETSEKISDTISSIISDKIKYNNLFIMIDSGARGSMAQVRQLMGMRGLMTKPDGSIIETPIISNFKEGLNVLEYFISTHGARKGLADTALKTANSGYLTRRLVDVAQDIVIYEYDCNTNDGLNIKIIDKLLDKNCIYERILGRVLCNDIINNNNIIIIKRNTLIDYNNINILEENNIDNITIRSPIMCNLNFGICVLCYGIDLSNNKLINKGEAVGIIAAQSIGEPGTQLTMRTFHIGGALISNIANCNIKFNDDGILKFINIKITKNKNNEYIIISKNSKLSLLDSNTNKIKEIYKVPYGSIIFKQDNDFIKKNEIISLWDPYNIPIISETEGIVILENIFEGVNYINKLDKYTGTHYKLILDNINKINPIIKIIDENSNIIKLDNNSIAEYIVTPKSIIYVNNNDKVRPGDILFKIPQNLDKIKDITGGLPKVSDLFEARNPKNLAILAEIDGIISFNEINNKKKIIIKSDKNNIYEKIIPKNKQINVFQGEFVYKGDIISDGKESIHDILRLRGVNNVINFIINEIQNVYILQGVKINSKHIEIIIKQMLKIVTITDSGDSNLLVNSNVNINIIKTKNKELNKENKKIIKYNYNLIGITKSSLLTDSFISSASFQETTKILTDAAISGKTDYLRGLKENIIVGRLIPAGTGFYYYKNKNNNNSK